MPSYLPQTTRMSLQGDLSEDPSQPELYLICSCGERFIADYKTGKNIYETVTGRLLAHCPSCLCVEGHAPRPQNIPRKV